MDTQNKAWAEDKSKFGYKMLEKMGWKEGRGLGAREDGIVSHIRVKRKRCNGGIGTQSRVESVWRVPGQVASGFNDVLARIAADAAPAPTVHAPAERMAETGEAKISYFGRRSRQKNVGQYSDAQLREIFGGAAVLSTAGNGGKTVKEGRVGKKEKKRKKEKGKDKPVKGDKIRKSRKVRKTVVVHAE